LPFRLSPFDLPRASKLDAGGFFSVTRNFPLLEAATELSEAVNHSSETRSASGAAARATAMLESFSGPLARRAASSSDLSWR
jgi:hypothetical protein